MFEQTPYNIFYHVIGIYEITLIITGTIGSILTFVVAFKLKQTTTFVFLLFLSITDTLCLFWWNLDDFILIYFNYWFQENSFFGCKIINYFQYVSMQSSAWLLVSQVAERTFLFSLYDFICLFKMTLSIDRFMSLWLKSWKSVYFKSKQALFVGFFIIAFFLLLHLNVWFTFGYRDHSVNGTYTDYCHSANTPTIKFMDLWNLVSFLT